MNVFILYAHPEPKSINGALKDAAITALGAQGHCVETSDLYAMGFNPVSGRNNFISVKNGEFLKLPAEEMHAAQSRGFSPELEAEMEKMQWCDLMIWQFPLWWFGLPAILKGWVDRVFAMGRIYNYDRCYESGILKGKKALLSLTTGAPADYYRPSGPHGDINAILRPIQRGMLGFVGFDLLAPHILYAPDRAPQPDLDAAVAAYRARLSQIEKEKPINVGRY